MAKLDTQTAELPGLPPLPKKRGRPATGNAKTAAQRVAESRARKKVEADNQVRQLDAALDLLAESRRKMCLSSHLVVNDPHMQEAYSLFCTAQETLRLLRWELT